MIAGFSGHLISEQYLAQRLADSFHDERVAGLHAEFRRWHEGQQSFGPATSLRTLLECGAAPVLKILGFEAPTDVEIRDNTAPVSIALIRQMMWRLSALDHPMEAHKIDSRGIYSRGQSPDVREGVSAFLNKRAAKFPQKISTDMPVYFPWWEDRSYS